MWEWIAEGIAEFLILISSFFLGISGLIFDWIMMTTIVNVAEMIGGPTGIGDSIYTAWRTLRDLANMCFIFVLLYVALKALFSVSFSGLGTSIKNIIIVALLINFSLFFTKVVIDASNIVSVGFYNQIINHGTYVVGGAQGEIKGIAGGYMKMLGVQTFSNKNILDGFAGKGAAKILLVGVMTSIFMLITAVVLLIVGIMFTARFIILIMLMILSPLALIAFIIPGMRGHFEKWKSALIDQSFFAPLYFALTWVVFTLGTSFKKSMTAVMEPKMPSDQMDFSNMFNDPSSVIVILINYVILIGFSIAALIFAKQMASRTAGFKMIAGGVGTVALGGAAWAGRQTIGRSANKIANDKALQERVAAGTATAGERLGLATSQKLAGSSFDLRGLANTKVGKYVGAEQAMGIAGVASGVGGQRAKMEKKESDRRKPIDATMRQFRDKPDVIAGYLMRQKSEDQQYVYDKLSARDRAAINEELDKLGAGGTAVKTKLMNNMSVDEREKTDKAGKDAAREAVNKTVRNEIENIVSGKTVGINPATGVLYTIDDLMGGGTLPTGWRPLRTNEARKLSNDALRDVDVVKHLSAKHLADITSDKDDLDDMTKKFIVSTVSMAPPYPLMREQHDYLNSTTTIKSYWGIP